MERRCLFSIASGAALLPGASATAGSGAMRSPVCADGVEGAANKNTVMHCGNIVKLSQISFLNSHLRLKPYYKKNSKTVEASNFFCLTDFNPTVEKSIERSVCKGKMA